MLSAHKLINTAVRYSSAKQDEISNEIQARLISEAYDNANPSGRIERAWEDVGSARQATRQQLEDIYAHLKRRNARPGRNVTLLLLLNWTRFFRNATAAMYWIEKFRQIGVEVNTVEKWIDHSDTNAILYLMIELFQAQKYSDHVQENIVRGNQEKFHRRIYCHRLHTRFYRRDYYDIRRYHVVAVEPAFSASQAAIRDVVYSAVPLEKAHRIHGGRKVLGPFNSWRQMLDSPRIKSVYKGEKMLMPEMVDDHTYDLLQSLLNQNKHAEAIKIPARKFDTYPTHGVLHCPECGRRTTTSNPRSGNGSRVPYQVCHHSRPSHYRVAAGRVNAALDEMVRELTATAQTTRAVMREAERQAKASRKTAEHNLKRLTKELKQLKQGYDNATLKTAMGTFTDAQLAMVEKHYQAKALEVEDAQIAVEHHADILREAMVQINDLGSLVLGSLEGERLNDFLTMAFPDGLFYYAEKGIFRTSSMNAAFSRTGWQSTDYRRIKIGDASLGETPPETWRQKAGLRTIAGDLRLFRAYQAKYETA